MKAPAPSPADDSAEKELIAQIQRDIDDVKSVLDSFSARAAPCGR